jgi:ankyrin repeat protein
MGRTALHYAVSKSNKNIIKILLASGADLNAATIGGDTPLIKAISFNQDYSVKILLRFGADFKIANKVS